MNKMFFVLAFILLVLGSAYALYTYEVSIGGLSPDWSKLTPKTISTADKDCEQCVTIAQCLACVDKKFVDGIFKGK